jgi:hypothetical protein
MFKNYELEILLLILISLIIISIYPLIELKYQSDLYENIETFNKYCLNYDISLINNLEVKDSYMWNISMYIYDYNNLSNFFHKKNDGNASGDYQGLNRDFSKVVGNEGYITDNIMAIYNKYLNMSLGLFIFLVLFFITQMYVLINIAGYTNLAQCITNGDIGISEYFRYYIYMLFAYILLFIIFFSLILKKLSELYADTDTYEYIMLMKEFDILLKENKPSNAPITNILKKHSKNKISDIRYKTINSLAANELLTAYEKKNDGKVPGTGTSAALYENNNNYKITLKNIERLEYYNSDESKDKVKNKVDDIFRFIYVYLVFLIAPIYILSISLQGNYMYLLFTLIILLIFSISVYNIYNALQN